MNDPMPASKADYEYAMFRFWAYQDIDIWLESIDNDHHDENEVQLNLQNDKAIVELGLRRVAVERVVKLLSDWLETGDLGIDTDWVDV